MKKKAAFTLISFAVLYCTEMRWMFVISTPIWAIELLVQIPVQLHLELEVNLQVQNVIELEFDLSRM